MFSCIWVNQSEQSISERHLKFVILKEKFTRINFFHYLPYSVVPALFFGFFLAQVLHPFLCQR